MTLTITGDGWPRLKDGSFTTGTVISTKGIDTDVFTTAVVSHTLVHIISILSR